MVEEWETGQHAERKALVSHTLQASKKRQKRGVTREWQCTASPPPPLQHLGAIRLTVAAHFVDVLGVFIAVRVVLHGVNSTQSESELLCNTTHASFGAHAKALVR